MKATVRITGLRETISAFRKLDSQLLRGLRVELRKAAEPVAESARAKLGRYRGASTGTVRPVAAGASVMVRQNASKVTGKRPDFGGLQMRNAFIPALDENADRIVDDVDQALDRFINASGF